MYKVNTYNVIYNDGLYSEQCNDQYNQITKSKSIPDILASYSQAFIFHRECPTAYRAYKMIVKTSMASCKRC